MIYWHDLKNGQKIKCLQKIFFVNEGSICINKNNDIYLTEEQITSGLGLTVIANVGDIGIWDKTSEKLVIEKLNSNRIEIDFSIHCDYKLNVNSDIFLIL